MAANIRSMTGFGRASASLEGIELRMEVRTLNGRYLDIKIRTPKELSALEQPLRSRIQSRLNRGRVDVSLDVEFRGGDQYQINETLALGLFKGAQRLQELGFQGDSLSSALLYPGVLEAKKLDSEAPELEKAVAGVTDAALDQVIELRSREGEALALELGRRLANLRDLAGRVEQASGSFAPHYAERLRRKIDEMSATQKVEESRLAQEILFYSERADISEEIARLKAHTQRFDELLQEPSPEGVGKNLDFLCQEMNREMNTIVSKSPLPEASALAVEGKLEIEKIREQVQNVE